MKHALTVHRSRLSPAYYSSESNWISWFVQICDVDDEMKMCENASFLLFSRHSICKNWVSNEQPNTHIHYAHIQIKCLQIYNRSFLFVSCNNPLWEQIILIFSFLCLHNPYRSIFIILVNKFLLADINLIEICPNREQEIEWESNDDNEDFCEIVGRSERRHLVESYRAHSSTCLMHNARLYRALARSFTRLHNAFIWSIYIFTHSYCTVHRISSHMHPLQTKSVYQMWAANI